MPRDTTDLAALIGSRICHDLISPIGAISNGLELMSLTKESDHSPEMELINDSCVSATARIRFFRIAFGSAGDGQLVSQREVLTILRDLGTGSRFRIEWNVPEDLPRNDVQIAFLALMCLETAMPVGGPASVRRDGERFVVEGTSARLNFDETLWSVLETDALEITISPAMVQFALLRVLLRDSGRPINVRNNPSQLTVTV